MDLYLMRHGEARPNGQDSQRPLTPLGRQAVERVAHRIAALEPRLERVYHSGILRAEQTADILASQLGGSLPVQERSGLRPLDAVEPVAQWLLGQLREETAVALVGHLPFLERLASRLVAGDESRQVLTLPAAGMVKLVPKQETDGFTIAWEIAPELA